MKNGKEAWYGEDVAEDTAGTLAKERKDEVRMMKRKMGEYWS